MKYRELVKCVQNYSGFSDQESEEALKLITETLASRLEPGERKDFASQLPSELQDFAMAPATGAMKFTKDDMYDQLGELEGIDTSHVIKQVMAVWKALKDAISRGELEHIRAQLPNDLAAELH
jgi:uncharacterized protein (DUF2267 family)